MTAHKGFFDRIETPDDGWGLCIPGMILGAILFGLSLTPSLIPRDPVMQGVLGGVVAGLGYWAGLYGLWVWRFLELPETRERNRARYRVIAFLAAMAISGAFLWKAADWQNETRLIMGLEPVETSHPLIIAGVAAAVFLLLWLVGRLFGFLMWRLAFLLNRILPRRIGVLAGFLLVFYVFWALTDGVLIRKTFQVADASFEAADILIEPDIPQPIEGQRTGSPESFIRWQEMGRWGRSFVSRAPTIEEISEFTGAGAMDPVRVYVGRRSGDTARERAELALKELIRAGGFERSVLIIVVPVGTGWMDPGGHDTVEFMLGGDVATVAVQYSYLTSALSLLANPEYGVEQARELFNLIYGHWTKLPKETRPELYVHGLSQGAFNSQRTVPLLDILGDPINGALWAGSPFLSPMWQHVRNRRHPDSPAWRPVYGNGSLVRVTNQENTAGSAEAPWGPMRLVFLHYASDPIVAFTFDTAFRRPDWMKGERAFDVSEKFSWFPVVTMFQLALDMAISLQVPRFGHFYVAPDYIDAWAEVVQPEGWSPARAAELKAIFERRPPPF